MLQFVMKPQTSSSSLGSKLGFAQLLGSKQPKAVGFNCCRRHTLQWDAKWKTGSHRSSSQQTNRRWLPRLQRADGLSGICRGNSGGAGFAQRPGTFLCDAVDVSAPCSIGSSSVFSPELIEPSSWFVLLFRQLLCWFGCFHNSPSPWKTHP